MRLNVVVGYFLSRHVNVVFQLAIENGLRDGSIALSDLSELYFLIKMCLVGKTVMFRKLFPTERVRIYENIGRNPQLQLFIVKNVERVLCYQNIKHA